MHRNANYAAKKGRAQKKWAVHQGKQTEIQLHLLRIIHLEICTQNISLVLSCESRPKSKLKATDNCIKRTLRKVNNPCTRKYKHRYFIPGGNNTSPSLMFLSLKLDIRGHEPTIKHNAPSWSHDVLLGQRNKKQRRTCKNTQELKHKR